MVAPDWHAVVIALAAAPEGDFAFLATVFAGACGPGPTTIWRDGVIEGTWPADALATGEGVTVGRVRIATDAPSDAEGLRALATLLDRSTAPDADAVRRKSVHDLRGCLAVVSGQCEMMESEIWGPMTEEQLRAVRAIRRQVDRMRPLIDALRGPVKKPLV
jgi:signal transduction histidine kinase